MKTFKFQHLATALVATVMATAFTGLAVAPAQAQTHSHGALSPPS